jgi:hypothetical protein
MKQDPDGTSHWINEYRINAARMRAESQVTVWTCQSKVAPSLRAQGTQGPSIASLYLANDVLIKSVGPL